MKTLVVYYSLKGHTKKAAELIAAPLSAELEEIREIRSRKGLWGFLRSGREAATGFAAPVLPAEHRAEEYDLVVVATPVWAGRPSSPVNGFLAQHGKNIARLGVVLTHADKKNEYDAAAERIGAACGKKPLAVLSSCGAPGEDAARAFAAKLQSAVSAP